MTTLGTPLTASATKILLLGSGELGKEVAIEAQRLGVMVVAVDRYPNAPAMQVAHRSHVVSMLDAAALRRIIEEEKPDFVVPEIEAIATDELLALEAEGVTVIPTARAARLTMNREGIRRLAAEELGLATSPYRPPARRSASPAWSSRSCPRRARARAWPATPRRPPRPGTTPKAPAAPGPGGSSSRALSPSTTRSRF